MLTFWPRKPLNSLTVTNDSVGPIHTTTIWGNFEVALAKEGNLVLLRAGKKFEHAFTGKSAHY